MIEPSHWSQEESEGTHPTSRAGIGRRTVLIGTSATLRGLVAQYQADRFLKAPIGCIVAATDGDARERTADGPAERGVPAFIAGVPVLGTLAHLAMIHQIEPITLALVSIPQSMSNAARRVLVQLAELGIACREVTSMADVINGGATSRGGDVVMGVVRRMNLMELVGRTPFGIDREAVSALIKGKRVLVTGAGGSIGSELCRIACGFGPSEIILVERAENNLFEINRQIERAYPQIRRRAALHDVVDAPRTLELLQRTRPEVVFHAAAHKHVPLMEDHPREAILNNVMGTKSIVDAAVATQCERFVMISSDKAVRPSSIMGATKRLAEMYIQSLARDGGATGLSMVRFGNVLGSACSVLPIWSAQLAEGGPITVTDARMTRYFMTIGEAAALVIQSAAIQSGNAAPDTAQHATNAAGRGEAVIHVLDMGEPVRIIDLAKRFIQQAGFRAQVQSQDSDGAKATQLPGSTHGERPAEHPEGGVVEIRMTGTRKGEKLHEELSYSAEALSKTDFAGIFALANPKAQEIDRNVLIATLAGLMATDDAAAVVQGIRRLVPEMVQPISMDESSLKIEFGTPNSEQNTIKIASIPAAAAA